METGIDAPHNGEERRIERLEDRVLDLEAALDHYTHDREAASWIAIRNQVDVARFGAGAVIKALPRAIAQSVMFRVGRRRRSRLMEQTMTARAGGGLDVFSTPGWQPLAPVPVPKVESTGAVVGDALFVFSGFGEGERFEPSSWALDLESGNWRELPAMPLPLSHAGMGVIGDDIWLVAGFVGHNGGPPSARVQIFNVPTQEWRLGPSLPVYRASMAAAVVGDRLHVFGGIALDRQSDAREHYVIDARRDGADWEEAAPLPDPGRNHLPAVTIDQEIFVMGGQQGLDGPKRNIKIAHAYDTETDQWRRIADLPFERHHCESSSFAWRDRVVVAGGLGPWQVDPLDDVVSYNPSTDTWTHIGSLPSQLWGSIAHRVGSDMVVATGAAESNSAVTAQTWRHPLPDTLP